MTDTPIFNTVAIIGVGLIGGSLGQVLRQRGLAREVVGFGRNETNLRDAVAIGAIDRYTRDLADAVSAANMIVVATPIGQMPSVFQGIRAHANPDCCITDVGSVKAQVVQYAHDGLGSFVSRFVAGHPIAGTERSGAGASFAELFEDHWVILTPEEDTDAAAVQQVEMMWAATGAKLQRMAVAQHDAILARTSHLPHALAFALVYLLATDPDADKHFELSSGGFYDFTRIAASDGALWRDICIANADAVAQGLDAYADLIRNISHSVKTADGDALVNIFDTARAARSGLQDNRRKTAS